MYFSLSLGPFDELMITKNVTSLWNNLKGIFLWNDYFCTDSEVMLLVCCLVLVTKNIEFKVSLQWNALCFSFRSVCYKKHLKGIDYKEHLFTPLPYICLVFYTSVIWYLKNLRSRVCKFVTKILPNKSASNTIPKIDVKMTHCVWKLHVVCIREIFKKYYFGKFHGIWQEALGPPRKVIHL